MIRTDGIPTIAFANLRHITEPEIEEDYVEEYIDYLLTENGVHIEPHNEFVIVGTMSGEWTQEDEDAIYGEDPWEKYLAMDRGDYEDYPESNIWDEPWAEYDWLLDPEKPVDLLWDTEPEL